MNIFIKPLLGISVLGGALLIAGCNNAATEVAGEAPATNPIAVQREADADAQSQAKAQADGHDHSGGMAGMPGMMARTHTTKLAFSSSPSAIPVGQPVTWTLQITDAKTGAPVNDFEVEMTKQMHLIVVKNDLSWFNHVHPTYQGNGKFTVTTQVPSPGTYKIYADYTIKGVGQEVPQAEFATAGQTVTPAKVSIVPDKMQGMWLVNRCAAHPESQPDTQGGAVYEVAMMPMPMKIVAGQDTMLHFQVRDAKGNPVKDLQPYLGAMGHCVILSSDTNSYLHSHPMSEGSDHSMGGMNTSGMKGMSGSLGGMPMGDMKMGGGSMGNMKMGGEMKMNQSGLVKAAPKVGGPDVMFHTNFPHPGLYKVWGQFQHRGQIITASYVVNVAPGQAKSTNAAGETGHAY